MTKIEDLLEKYNKQQNQDFIVRLGTDEYQCHKLPFKKLLALDDEYDVETQQGAYNRNLEAIYLSCEVFRELANKLEFNGEPHNVVEEVLTPIEVLSFYTHILNQYLGQAAQDAELIKK